MCLVVCLCSLIDRLTSFKITSIWIVEPLGFAYGIIAANHSNSIKKWIGDRWGKKSIALLVISGILGLAYLKYKPVAFFGDYLLKIVLGIVITTFVFTVIGKIRAGNKANRLLGKISYEVYLLHGCCFTITMLMGAKLNSGVFIWISLAFTVVLSIVLHWICSAANRKIKG